MIISTLLRTTNDIGVSTKKGIRPENLGTEEKKITKTGYGIESESKGY